MRGGPGREHREVVRDVLPGWHARRVDRRATPEESPRDRRHQPASTPLELHADHPQLLLERAHDVGEDVLGGGVDLAEAIHALAGVLGGARRGGG